MTRKEIYTIIEKDDGSNIWSHIYDVFMFEDVPVDTLENIRLKYAFDELKDLGFEGGYERSEYVPTDVDTYDVPYNIDWGSYIGGSDYVVIFNGNVAINRA